jgi:prepilin peptidase CpaA
MIATLAFTLLLAVAAISDIRHLRIPNLIPLLLVVGFALQAGLGGVPSMTGHLLAMLIVLALLIPLFALNALGGGDVKLLAAAALWLGIADLPLLLVGVAILGGFFAALWLPLRWAVARALPDGQLPASLKPQAALPYGVPIGVASLLLHLDAATPVFGGG